MAWRRWSPYSTTRIITIGLFSLFNKPISLTVVAALLTLVGYSMNDTIVVFDRIRENLKMVRRESLTNIINLSVNQTLSRTVLTSGLTLLTALALLSVRRRRAERVFFCPGGGYHCGDVFFGFCRQSNFGILAELPRRRGKPVPRLRRSSGNGGPAEGRARVVQRLLEEIGELWRCLIRPS